jgi:hypothetical protein
LSGTNALAYYEKAWIIALKSFIILATGHCSYCVNQHWT